MGGMATHLFLIVYMCAGYTWRMAICIPVALLGILCRLLTHVVMPHTLRPRGTRVNRRILVITDYMPPQVHGIAVRCHNYVENMRAGGDEVVVFCTTKSSSSLQSFDYPILPSVVNPLNTGNRVCFGPSIVLAWHLGASSWDCVHVFFPTLIAGFILPICRLRGIPTYCSHHVDMDFYGPRYVGKVVGAIGNAFYWLVAKLPAVWLGTVNAAPTFVFLRQHMPGALRRTVVRIPSGVEDGMAPAATDDAREADRAALRRRAGADGTAALLLMVQRVGPEKGTSAALDAVAHLCAAGESVHLIIAGDGPSRAPLAADAAARGIPVTFLGAVPHAELPPLYRGADAFVTCSTSETYGLTIAEALSCGTPAVMPRHPVFDELWAERLPQGWRYDPAAGAAAAAAAVRAAVAGRRWLAAHPINCSWSDGTRELLRQYDGITQKPQGRPKMTTIPVVGNAVTPFGLAALAATLLVKLKPMTG